ncbi:hypothetical protein [Paenibacillus ginsengarvi]|nr:hypothetical protein [Paenibacillus ginsengarvi]
MYNFLLGMWKLKRIDEEKLLGYAAKSIISASEAAAILAQPQHS